VRRVIHHCHQFGGFVDDGCAVSPGKYGGKKSCDFNILLFGEKMGHANRVVLDERNLVELVHLAVQKVNESCRRFLHLAKLGDGCLFCFLHWQQYGKYFTRKIKYEKGTTPS
jgi:hypothetical protein